MLSNHKTFDTKAYKWGESWMIYFNCLNDVLWLLVLCYLCLPRSAFVWLAMCDCGISWSYSLTFVAFGQALHQANRLQNLLQLFNAENHAIRIKPVHGFDDAIAKFIFYKCVDKNRYKWGESWLIYFNCLNDVLWLLVLCYLCLPRSAFVWLAMCDCGISWSYSLTFVAFGQALHQANRLQNLLQLFNAERHAIIIKPVHGFDDANAKFVFTNVWLKLDMYISLIILTKNDSYNFHAIILLC